MRRSMAWGMLAMMLAIVAGDAAAEITGDRWAHWRGPLGTGEAPSATPPVEFGPEKNLRWKVEIPGSGSSSAVVWDDRVFVTTGVPLDDGRTWSFRVLCFDRASGRKRWEQTAVEAVPHEGTHETNSFASASPCTDGEHVYASFGSRGLFCYTMDGELVWSRDFGDMTMRGGFGEGSSPTLSDELVLVPWDHEGPSKFFAVEKKTGTTVWEVDRDEPTCWATPLVAAGRDGTQQVVMNGQNAACSYDLATGKVLWTCGGQTQRPCASAVAEDGVAYVMSGFRGAYGAAFDLDGRGDLAGSDAVLWSVNRNTPDVASPLLFGGKLYYYKEKTGLLTCIDAASGSTIYATKRLPGMGRTYASPIAAAGHIYLTDRSGAITVITAGDDPQVVATNDMGEGVDATPAADGNDLFIRGEKHIFCVERKTMRTPSAAPTDKTDPNYDEEAVEAFTLPNILEGPDGVAASTAKAWEQTSRPYQFRQLQRFVYGQVLPPVAVTVVGNVERAEVTLPGPGETTTPAIRLQARLRLGDAANARETEVLCYLPAASKSPVPTFLKLNFAGNQAETTDPDVWLTKSWVRDGEGVEDQRATEASRGLNARRFPAAEMLSQGYGMATAYCGDFFPDHPDGRAQSVLPSLGRPVDGDLPANEPGAIAAWAWGLSRILDWLITLPEVDGERVIVVGHSRLGKTALWAGACDPRFAMVVSNESGCGGAALSRRNYGETVGVITSRFPHWFCPSFASYAGRELELPVDQHTLLAMAAPRPLYVASAEGDRWADPRGEFLAAEAVGPVWKLYGRKGLGTTEYPPVGTPIGSAVRYHVRAGKHDLLLEDWQHFADMADDIVRAAVPVPR